jgi:hypothetical protein
MIANACGFFIACDWNNSATDIPVALEIKILSLFIFILEAS